MALPSLYSISTGKSIQTAFGGLNESYACAEAEFTEMKNFSSRGIPRHCRPGHPGAPCGLWAAATGCTT